MCEREAVHVMVGANQGLNTVDVQHSGMQSSEGKNNINDEQGEVRVSGQTARNVDEKSKTTKDDSFDLVPIIEAVMGGERSKKRLYHEVTYEEHADGANQKQNRPRKIRSSEAEETSLEGSPSSP